MMITNCSRCGKRRLIHNPKQERRLCISCYNQEHHDIEKARLANKRWQRKNLKYFRDYYQNVVKKKK